MKRGPFAGRKEKNRLLPGLISHAALWVRICAFRHHYAVLRQADTHTSDRCSDLWKGELHFKSSKETQSFPHQHFQQCELVREVTATQTVTKRTVPMAGLQVAFIRRHRPRGTHREGATVRSPCIVTCPKGSESDPTETL